MAKRVGANKVNLEQTRKNFLELAEKEFIAYGYARASTTRIVNASGMARGSLYYHFKDKQDIFKAVYQDVAKRLSVDLETRLATIDDPWAAFMTACEAYFDICTSPDKSRIFLVESQAVLPYEQRHAIISETIRPVLTGTLDRLSKQGYFDGKHREMLAILVFGALGEAGRMTRTMPNHAMVQAYFFDTFKWAMQKLA